MEFEIWHIWIILAILLFIAEIFTPAFLAVCLAIGCIIAAIFSYFEFGIEVQLSVFSIGTLTSIFGVRPFIIKYGHRKSNQIKTNVEALVGKIGRVTVAIDNSQNQGRVTIEGDDWKAETENNEILNVGERVEILKINSTILTVKSIIKED